MNGVVYMITCLITGYRYIGSTVNFVRRMQGYKRGEGHGLIGESIAEHGWGNHDVIKLAQGISDAELRACEYEFIAELQPELNQMASTAGGRLHHAESSIEKISAGKQNPSPETRAKMRQAKLGKKHSPETRAKISAAQRGKKQPPEAVAKTAAFLRGRKQSPEHAAKVKEGQREHSRTLHRHRALKELRELGWPKAA